MKKSYYQQQHPQPQLPSLVTNNISSTLKNFVSLGKIGQGAFSQVHKVRRISDGKIYALKRIKLSSLKPKQQQYAISEIKILAALDCPYIISFRQSFYQQNTRQLCIVMEWANEGDLQNQIEKRKKMINEIIGNGGYSSINKNPYTKESNKSSYYIPESEIWRAVRDILTGLVTLHNSSILHRDIKTANIFKSQGIYKLGDLNIAKICPGLAYAYTQTGTPYYASPQVWKQLPYNTKSDIWSFGCVIYEMCQLIPPFMAKDMDKLYELVIKGRYKPIDTGIYSKQLEKLIGICLKNDPKQRLSCKEILELGWVKQKFCLYNIKNDQNIPNNNTQIKNQRHYTQNVQLNSPPTPYQSITDSKQINIQLSKEIREIRSITQPSTQYNNISNILPQPKYPSQNKSKCNNNYSYIGKEKQEDSIRKDRPSSSYRNGRKNKQNDGQIQSKEEIIDKKYKKDGVFAQIDLSESAHMQTEGHQIKKEVGDKNQQVHPSKEMKHNSIHKQQGLNKENKDILQKNLTKNSSNPHKKSKKKILIIPTNIHNNKIHLNTSSNQENTKYKHQHKYKYKYRPQSNRSHTSNSSYRNKTQSTNNILKEKENIIREQIKQNGHEDIYRSKGDAYDYKQLLKGLKYNYIDSSLLQKDTIVNKLNNRNLMNPNIRKRPISSYIYNNTKNYNNLFTNPNNNGEYSNSINKNTNTNDNQLYKIRPMSADSKYTSNPKDSNTNNSSKYIGTIYKPAGKIKPIVNNQLYYKDNYNIISNSNNNICQSLNELPKIKSILNNRSNNNIVKSSNNVGKLYYNYNNLNNMGMNINSNGRNYIKDTKMYKNIYNMNNISNNGRRMFY